MSCGQGETRVIREDDPGDEITKNRCWEAHSRAGTGCCRHPWWPCNRGTGSCLCAEKPWRCVAFSMPGGGFWLLCRDFGDGRAKFARQTRDLEPCCILTSDFSFCLKPRPPDGGLGVISTGMQGIVAPDDNNLSDSSMLFLSTPSWRGHCWLGDRLGMVLAISKQSPW